jgi:hypothetical protein
VNEFRTRRKILGIFIILFCAGTMSFVVVRGCHSSATVNVQRLLADAKLAPLPPSATNVAYHQWGKFFSHETFARFELNQMDLNAFMSNSPALRNLRPRMYNSNSNHLLYPPIGENIESSEHDHFFERPGTPPWFDMSVRGKGRKYVLDWGPGMWVVIDEEKPTVWLNVGN